MRHLLLPAILTTTILGCGEPPPPPSRSQAPLFGGPTQPDPSGLDTVPVCVGDRRLLSGPARFRFDTTEFHLPNVYWLAAASTAVYAKGAPMEAALRRWAPRGLTRFEFYGDGNDGGRKRHHETQGFWAEFDAGHLVVFRGTAGMGDIMTDLKGSQETPGLALSQDGELVPTKIHTGFSHALDQVWDAMIEDHLRDVPQAAISEEEAFRRVDKLLSRVGQVASIEQFNPNELFDPHIDEMVRLGLLDLGENGRFQIMGAINVWADTVLLEMEARRDGDDLDSILARSLRRKKSAFERTRKLWRFPAFKPIWLSGHSLGAAIATVAAYRFQLYGVPVQGLVTYGSPRVGDRAFAHVVERAAEEDGVTENFVRHVNDNDMVTTVPLSGPSETLFGNWTPVFPPAFLDSTGMYHLPNAMLPEERVSNHLMRLRGSRRFAFYSDRPEGQKGLWTLDLFQGINDHLMTTQYVPHIEALLFGGPADGCE